MPFQQALAGVFIGKHSHAGLPKPHFHWHLLLNVACPGTVILNPLAWWVILLAAGYQTAHLLHPVIMKGFLENGCLWLFTRSLQAPFSKKTLLYYYSQYTTCLKQLIYLINFAFIIKKALKYFQAQAELFYHDKCLGDSHCSLTSR